MCGYFQQTIYANTIGGANSFPVGPTQTASIFSRLLNKNFSIDTIKRICKRYNKYCEDNSVIGIERIESKINIHQLESLFYFIISFIDADRRDILPEYLRSDICEQYDIKKSTLDDYRRYAGEEYVRFAYRDNYHPVFSEHDCVLFNRIKNEGKLCLKEYANWPVTQFIKSFDNKITDLSCTCAGTISYEKMPGNKISKKDEIYGIEISEIATSQICIMIVEDNDEAIIDQAWMLRVIVDDQDGKKYRGIFYWLFDTSLPNGEIEFDIKYEDPYLLLSGKYRVKRENNWFDIFIRILPKHVNPIEIPLPQ